MKEFLSEQKVDYVEYNVEENPQYRKRMMEKARNTVIPTLIVGDEVVFGYDEDKLEDLFSN
ncbi:MAG: glutaredoxin family protein [Firmicutes bacterium]|nr:glutaredoxin family protein [Bacillota bacterium]